MTSKFYFRFGEFLGTELRSGNQAEEHIDDPGEVEQRDTDIKNVAADDTLRKLNVKNRGRERGATMTEYSMPMHIPDSPVYCTSSGAVITPTTGISANEPERRDER